MELQSLTSLFEQIHRVAVVDDETAQAELTCFKLEEAGFEPVIVKAPTPFKTHEQLTAAITELNVQGLVCDHRLTRHQFSQFNGASYVASLYGQLPSVLTTQYIDIDVDVSIREHRSNIPVLLSRDETLPKILIQAFQFAVEEFSGRIAPQRQPHLALVRVTDKSSEGNQEVVDAIIPQWNPRRAVRFPLSLLPPLLRASVEPGTRLLSLVNIGAKSSEDLYFRDFQLAPEPDPEDGLV